MTIKKTLFLASASFRRQQILSNLGWPFILQPVDADESVPDFQDQSFNELLEAVKKTYFVVEKKLKVFLKGHHSKLENSSVVLAADTMVQLKGELLGKPKDLEEATVMLKNLRKCWHDVITAWIFYEHSSGKIYKNFDHTKVLLKNISDEQIQKYVCLKTCLDRAGSYGIQDESFPYVEKIEGSFFNVVGLPKEKIEEQVLDLNWSFK